MNNPMLPMYSTTTPIDPRAERLDAICDQARYLLTDWLEYTEKQGAKLTFQQYVSQWTELFEAVSAKMSEASE